MGYRNLTACITDLERTRQLIRIEQEIDPHLEAAEIQRRVYRASGPAVFFVRVRGTPFPMVSNLFGTIARARFLFRDTLDSLRKLVELKLDPTNLRKRPWRYWNIPLIAWQLRPKFVRAGPILAHTALLSQLPQLKCWPRDGGAFVTLPEVYTEHPDRPGWRHSNLGMYRVQLSGNAYIPDRECGLHYQIHRGIGIHHAAALRRGEPLAVNVIIGGPPALALAAVMPLPEGMPELAFAGVLGGQRVRMIHPADRRQETGQPRTQLPFPAEADFVISGYINPTETKPEGPFGDHLGYYSLAHDFPLMKVTAVYHRPGAVWPFTVVGRPPQEDTSFGELIHELTGPVIPTVIPGIHAVHAVDAAGVHPLLLAIGSERYVPYAATRRPQELLTLANAILGQGQLSLAKYLFLAAKEDAPNLDIHDIAAFFRHILERFDPETDLHFHTRTTIDTLDYSAGMGLNAGSKVVIAATGPKRRSLSTELPPDLKLPDGFTNPRVVLPGILTIGGPPCEVRSAERGMEEEDLGIRRLIEGTDGLDSAFRLRRSVLEGFPLLVVVDDSEFAAGSLRNWLWVTFTRSDPANDVHGVAAFISRKHWGCKGSVVIDARIKPYMAPPLEEDPTITKRVDMLFARGGALHGIE
ncbi:MAG TPA: UbiD family decarboxylase [Gemmata sp.]|nr:UbiD family decarboxylase [Gemmata sp.]